MPVVMSSGGRAAPASPPVGFQPTDPAGLIVWFDATDAATIVKDGSDKVSLWIDKAPSSPTHDASQGTAADQPTWISGGINANDAIEFFNSEYLVAAGGAWNQITNVTLFAVHKPDLLAGVHFLAGTPFDGGDWADPWVGWQIGYQGTNSRYLMNITGTDREWNIGSGLSSQGYVQTLWYDGATRKSHLDGTENFNNSDFTGNIQYETPAPDFAIGVRSNSAVGEYYDGLIGEIVAYDNALSAADLAAVHSYLKTKWSIS